MISSTWTPSFYGYDGHGSVRQLTNSTGAETDRYDYDAFGNVINQTGSTPNNYLFAGEQFDPALGLYYNHARYLNTTTGRFWSMDTEEGDDEEPSSLHKYLYASSDPVNRIDPSGHDDLAEISTAEGIQATIQTMSNGVGTLIRAYNFVQNALSIADYATFALNLVQAAGQPSPALAKQALIDVIVQKFGLAGAQTLTGGLQTALAKLSPNWGQISSAIEREAPVIAEELAPSVARRLPTYLALQEEGRLKTVFFAPSGPFGGRQDKYIDVGSHAQVALSIGGGRLFGLGVRTSAGNVDQLFRIDYWDVSPGRPTPTPLHVHYHLIDDTAAHPPDRTIWP
jgi:RHS repeat-associated protein